MDSNERDFPTILSEIVSDRALEVEWLDLLSQVEYIGCRKIIKAVPYHSMSLAILRHISEEASHAFLLRSVAETLGGQRQSWRESKLGEVGWAYLSEMDERISRVLGEISWNYPGVSWAVEQRVMQIYPLYLKATREESVRHALRRILAEEERHGAEFAARGFTADQKQRMLGIEAELWIKFQAGLSAWLAERRLSARIPLNASGAECGEAQTPHH